MRLLLYMGHTKGRALAEGVLQQGVEQGNCMIKSFMIGIPHQITKGGECGTDGVKRNTYRIPVKKGKEMT